LTDEARIPKKGEIWYVRFDPTIGSEIQKTRPAVVVNEKHMGREGLRIVVPVTEWQTHHEFCRWMFRLSIGDKTGLTKESGADASQVKSLSVKRFHNRIGMLTDSELKEILAAIVVCIGYECPVCRARENKNTQ